MNHFSPEENAVLLLSRAKLGDLHVSQLKGMIKNQESFSEVLSLSELNASQVLTFLRLSELGLFRSCEEWERFSQKAKQTLLRAERRTVAARKVLEWSHLEGIELIPLKGMLLGPIIYHLSEYKKMNDFDFLIRLKDVRRFLHGMRAMGFSSVGDLFHDGEITEKNHHTPPFVNADQSCILGIHWGLCSRHARWRPNTEEIWNRAVRTNILEVPALRMSWEHNLAHLCFHLPFFKIGVREISDVSNLILFAEPKIDWSAFLQICRQWKIDDPAFRVLSLAQVYLKVMGDEQAAQSMDSVIKMLMTNADAFSRKDTANRVAVPGLLLRSRSVQVGRVEKAFSVLRLTQNPIDRIGAWVMTWVWTFFPKLVEAQRIVGKLDPAPLTAFRRMQAGPRIWRALARDYGNLAVLLMTAYNVFYVCIKTLFAPFQKWGPRFKNSPEGKLLELLE